MSVWATTPLVVGHRGGRGDGWPRENTIPAFERARREGAPAVELDVRTCAGGEVVVEHDATLSRTTMARDSRRVRDVRASELAAFGIPTLAEALRWASAAGVAVNVEMKHDVPSRLRLARATARDVAAIRADVLISSFDPLLLALFAFLAPTVPRALLVHSGQALWADLLQRAARPPWLTSVHLERTQADVGLVSHHLRRGLRIGAWTVNDPREAVRLADLGIASIITDQPGLIIDALGAHSQRTSSTRTPGGGD